MFIPNNPNAHTNPFLPRPTPPAIQNLAPAPAQGPTFAGSVRAVTTAIANHPILFASAVAGLAASVYTGSYYLGAAAAGATSLLGNKLFAAANTPQSTPVPISQPTPKRVIGYIPQQTSQFHTFPAQAASIQLKPPTLDARFAFFARHYGFIWFYKSPENKETEVFGNFYNRPLTYRGVTYPCSEAAFQAQKFIHQPALMAQFANFDGKEAARKAKEWKALQRTDWKNVSLHVMRDVLQVKFQDPKLRSLLLATGSAYLVEHIPVKGRDDFYGDDNDGTGQNNLGKLLMDVRQSLGGTGRVNPPPAYLANATRLK